MAERTLDDLRAQYLMNWEQTAGIRSDASPQLTSPEQALAPVNRYGQAVQREEVNHDTRNGLGAGFALGITLAIFFATHGAPELAAAALASFTAAGGAVGNGLRRSQA